MKIEKILQYAFVFAGCLLIFLSQKSHAEISAEEQQKIQKACPAAAFAQPVKPRKILVSNLNVRNGTYSKGHVSISYGNYALKLMGEKTGAFEITVMNDTLAFKQENLKQYDALCFLNTAGVLFSDPELRINILDFVSQGGGFIGIHAAAATFVQWPEYWQFPAFGQMLGAYEDGGHPWKPDETIYLKVEEMDHPLTNMFGQVDIPVQDEVFQFRAPYSRDFLRILLTINTEKTDMNPDRRFLPQRFADKDFAMSWIREYGKGRVFYSSLGHNPHIFWDQALLTHFLAGIQFALGDLAADATPSNKR